MAEINPEVLLAENIIKSFQDQHTKVAVPKTSAGMNKEIRQLFTNDYTGIIVPVTDFMVTTATVDFYIETPNPNLNIMLSNWQSTVNLNVGKDIAPGLNNVQKQYYKERWQKSSLIVLKVQWGESEGGWVVPINMFFIDGSQVQTEASSDELGKYSYYLVSKIDKKEIKQEIKSDNTSSIYIRKPYTSWYDVQTIPYLARRGALYHAMFKRELLKKQGEMLGAVLPYLLTLKAGNDTLAKLNSLATQPELDAVKDQLKDIRNKYTAGVPNTGIGAFNYDVNLEHFMPEFNKMINDNVFAPIDRNLLSALGLIELEGFSNSRKEAILNPKVLVEEVTDGVKDFTDLVYDVTFDMMNRNLSKHPKWAAKEVRIIPSTIKAFVTNDMKVLIRSWYDRGLVSYKSALSSCTELDFEVEVQRRKVEDDLGLPKLLYPRLIMNQEANLDPELTPDELNNVSPEKLKTENQFSAEEILAVYKSINDLPPAVKNNLPKAAQRLFMTVVNKALKDGASDADAFKLAWGVVKKYFYKNRSNKWVKKSK